jgi:hypothetical protein
LESPPDLVEADKAGVAVSVADRICFAAPYTRASELCDSLIAFSLDSVALGQCLPLGGAVGSLIVDPSAVLARFKHF